MKRKIDRSSVVARSPFFAALRVEQVPSVSDMAGRQHALHVLFAFAVTLFDGVHSSSIQKEILTM